MEKAPHPLARYQEYLKAKNAQGGAFWKILLYSDGSGFIVSDNGTKTEFVHLRELDASVDAELAPKCPACNQKLPNTQ